MKGFFDIIIYNIYIIKFMNVGIYKFWSNVIICIVNYFSVFRNLFDMFFKFVVYKF